jgi:large subunit ribosomal protein L9
MKVILEKDILGLGLEGEVVEVARGYANNYLIPQQLAKLATKGNLKQLQMKEKALERNRQIKREAFQKEADKISGKTVTIKVAAGEEGRLFGSVSTRDLSEAMASQLKIEVDRRKIGLKYPIKELGSYQVKVKLYQDIEPEFTVEVVAEKQESKKS